MRFRTLIELSALAAVIFAAVFAGPATAATIYFDDFNVNEGHFASAPNASGSNSNIAATSTADRITTASFEGDGNEQLVVNTTATAATSRLRFLSGGGTPANNTSFTTSAAEDGWIGLALKTEIPGWTVQLWIEGASNNGGIEKTITADGQWHIYEWNLDDTTGGADGWGTISGIIAGVATVADGSHTIDSVIFRHGNPSPATGTIFMDFVAKSDSGSIGNLVPEQGTLALAMFGMITACLSARSRQA